MIAEHAAASFEAEVGFAPVENALPLRGFRWLHLVPAGGLGTVRRAVRTKAIHAYRALVG
jgi:hypothetical protein